MSTCSRNVQFSTRQHTPHLSCLLNVTMRINSPRQNEHARCINHLRAVGDFEVARLRQPEHLPTSNSLLKGGERTAGRGRGVRTDPVQ